MKDALPKIWYKTLWAQWKFFPAGRIPSNSKIFFTFYLTLSQKNFLMRFLGQHRPQTTTFDRNGLRITQKEGRNYASLLVAWSAVVSKPNKSNERHKHTYTYNSSIHFLFTSYFEVLHKFELTKSYKYPF